MTQSRKTPKRIPARWKVHVAVSKNTEVIISLDSEGRPLRAAERPLTWSHATFIEFAKQPRQQPRQQRQQQQQQPRQQPRQQQQQQPSGSSSSRGGGNMKEPSVDVPRPHDRVDAIRDSRAADLRVTIRRRDEDHDLREARSSFASLLESPSPSSGRSAGDPLLLLPVLEVDSETGQWALTSVLSARARQGVGTVRETRESSRFAFPEPLGLGGVGGECGGERSCSRSGYTFSVSSGTLYDVVARSSNEGQQPSKQRGGKRGGKGGGRKGRGVRLDSGNEGRMDRMLLQPFRPFVEVNVKLNNHESLSKAAELAERGACEEAMEAYRAFARGVMDTASFLAETIESALADMSFDDPL
eukprot:GHVU01090050.1.p1 GENE.GHVU01090050.1~~GHVU01090050.1.p1  ORF type:complete len:357 (+),score=69.14 GHVU01090050.1:114-1184(+)